MASRVDGNVGIALFDLHKEIHFETEICEYLAVNGWLYSQGDAAGYDRALALFPADVVAWGAGHSVQSLGRIEQEPRHTVSGYIAGTTTEFTQSTRHARCATTRR
jgi:hypothetical protein